jgi:hypothetical protein
MNCSWPIVYDYSFSLVWIRKRASKRLLTSEIHFCFWLMYMLIHHFIQMFDACRCFVVRCIYEPLVVTTSCLDHSGKRALKATVCKLGGHVIGEWINDCSLVVMSKLQVTIKVCARLDVLPFFRAALLLLRLSCQMGNVHSLKVGAYVIFCHIISLKILT